MLKVAGGGGGAGAVKYLGTWNASTNTPTLTSGVGNQGDYYVVSVSGNTDLDGITDWVAGDWAIFNGTVWQKVDNTESVVSVNGQTGVVVLTAANVNAVPSTATITAGSNLTGGGNLVSNVTISLVNNPNVSNITVDLIDFNETAGITPSNSQLTWSNDDRTKTLALGINGDQFYMFEDQIFRVKATSNITKGQVVMFTGTLGASGGLEAAPATGLLPEQSNYILGISKDTFTTGNWGNVQCFGEVKGFDTTGGAENWVQGDVLYYNPSVAGGLTKIKPTAPAAIAVVAAVVYVSASNGIVFVRPTFGSVLGGTDGNVNFNGLANNDVIVYNSASNVWVNKTQANLTAGTGLTGGGQLLSNTNVSIALANTAVTPGTYGGGTDAAAFVVDAQGRLTSASNVAIPQGTVTSVGTGTGLTGGTITSSGTISLANTTVTAGTYGSLDKVPQITIDAQGRITSAANVSISSGGGIVVTGFVTITAGSEVEWTNNSASVISWTNNSSNVIAWVNNTYLVTSNNATIFANASVQPLFVQLPSASTVSGQQFIVKKIDNTANYVTITTSSSQKIDNANTYALSSQYTAAGVQSDNANYWIISEVA